jgi:acyl carrier protein
MKILTERYEVPAEQVSPDVRFEDLSLDSLALIELSLAIERGLGVSVAEGVLAPELTVAQAAAVVTTLPASS